MDTVFCRCCGAQYDTESYSALPPAAGGAIWDEPEIAHLELRNCPCGSTLSRPLVPVELMAESPAVELEHILRDIHAEDCTIEDVGHGVRVRFPGGAFSYVLDDLGGLARYYLQCLHCARGDIPTGERASLTARLEQWLSPQESAP